MRKLILTLICFSSVVVFGQTFELHHHEWDSISPYEYWLTFNYPDEPNQVKLISETNNREEYLTIEGIITDYQDSALDVFIHRLDPVDSSEALLYFPENGYFHLDFESSFVLLKFSLMNQVKTQYLLINSDGHKRLKYSIKLGRDQPFNKYIIHSERELTDQEIKETMKCIMKFYLYDDNKVWDCDQGKDFFIGMTCG